MEFTSPYNYVNYDFISENKSDLDEDFIEYSEKNLNRLENTLKIFKLITDIENAIKIELSVFEFSLLYCKNNDIANEYIVPVYNDKINNIFIAFNKSKKFETELLNIINPSHIGFYTPEQLFPEKWEHIILKKNNKEQHENNIVYSDAYKCYKCGESKCKISMKQIRSADEPMTTFVNCLICGNSFKIN